MLNYDGSAVRRVTRPEELSRARWSVSRPSRAVLCARLPSGGGRELRAFRRELAAQAFELTRGMTQRASILVVAEQPAELGESLPGHRLESMLSRMRASAQQELASTVKVNALVASGRPLRLRARGPPTRSDGHCGRCADERSRATSSGAGARNQLRRETPAGIYASTPIAAGRPAAERGQPRPERERQEDLRLGRRVLRADPDRDDLRHELRAHARAARRVGIPGGARRDVRDGRWPVCDVPGEEVAVSVVGYSSAASQAGWSAG